MMIEGLTGITKSSYTGDDLISREQAIDAVVWVLDSLVSTDTVDIDAVEVIRCKDCKHRHEAECPMYWEEQFDIDEGDGYYDTDYIFHDYTQDNGYCSWGERIV